MIYETVCSFLHINFRLTCKLNLIWLEIFELQKLLRLHCTLRPKSVKVSWSSSRRIFNYTKQTTCSKPIQCLSVQDKLQNDKLFFKKCPKAKFAKNRHFLYVQQFVISSMLIFNQISLNLIPKANLFPHNITKWRHLYFKCVTISNGCFSYTSRRKHMVT